jgi:hypothetical protein
LECGNLPKATLTLASEPTKDQGGGGDERQKSIHGNHPQLPHPTTHPPTHPPTLVRS